MNTWILVFEEVIEKLINILSNLLIKNKNFIKEFQEIFLYSSKKITGLILNNKIKPIKLIDLNYSIFY